MDFQWGGPDIKNQWNTLGRPTFRLQVVTSFDDFYVY